MRLHEARRGSKVKCPDFHPEICYEIPVNEGDAIRRLWRGGEAGETRFTPYYLSRDDWQYVDEPEYLPSPGDVVTVERWKAGNDLSWMGDALLVLNVAYPLVTVKILKCLLYSPHTLTLNAVVLRPFGDMSLWKPAEREAYEKHTSKVAAGETEEWPLRINADGSVFAVAPTGIWWRPSGVMQECADRFRVWCFRRDGVVDEHPANWRAWWCKHCKEFAIGLRRANTYCGHGSELQPVIAACAVMRKG